MGSRGSCCREVQSKGEKTTGEREFVYVGTNRLRDAPEKRRFAIRNDPDAYVFGTEDGRHQKDFRRMWRELFTRAGLKYGRDRGVVWHTLRHEFCSRTPRTRRPGGRPGAGAPQGPAHDAGLSAPAALTGPRRSRPFEPEVIWIA